MTQSNIKIAITGGIGSGKSTVAEIIANQGFTVISCDEIYNNLLQSKDFLNRLYEEFGNVLADDGNLDKKKLSEIVFSDKEKLKRLNELTHPAIMNEAIKRMSGKGIFFCEVPLLFECGYEKLFDKIIVVLRDASERVSAIVNRDKIEEKEAYSRINSQIDYEKLQFEKYYVIHNNCGLIGLKEKTIKLLNDIRV